MGRYKNVSYTILWKMFIFVRLICVIAFTLCELNFASADELERYEEIICHDNEFEPVRICIGNSFILEESLINRLGKAFQTTRFRMNATNVKKLREFFENWADGTASAPYISRHRLQGANQSVCKKYDESDWSNLSKAMNCEYQFPGFFEFSSWLDRLARDKFELQAYDETVSIFMRNRKIICASQLLPWLDGNMIANFLQGFRGGDLENEIGLRMLPVANEVQQLQKKISQ